MSTSCLALCVLAICSLVHATTIYFAIDIRRGTVAPDGYIRSGILVNGSLPGPALILDYGDDVEFHVHNGLDEKTAIHFHGIEQHGTPWSDGVPGLSQRPIPAGGDWVYKWTATQYGTYWYHGHYQAQLMDGLYGAIHIRSASSEPRPFDLITQNPDEIKAIRAAEEKPHLIMISDWHHLSAEQLFQAMNDTNLDIYCSQSILFDGKGRVNCLTPEEQHAALAPPFQAQYAPGGPMEGLFLSASGCMPFCNFTQSGYPGNLHDLPGDPSGIPQEVTECHATFEPLQDYQVDPADGWVSLNIINAAMLQAPVVSLDQHDMWVYAVHGRYVEPYKVQGMLIYNGERISAMVRLNKTAKSYMLRASNFGQNQLLSGFATVTYAGARGNGDHPPRAAYTERRASTDPGNSAVDKDIARIGQPLEATTEPFFTYGTVPVSPNVVQFNSNSPVIGFPNIPPARDSQQTLFFHLSRFNAPWIWTISGTATYPSLGHEYAEDEPLLFHPYSVAASNSDLVVRTQNNTWVDLVFTASNIGGPPHPMHKHNNKAYVIGAGEGEWTWSSVAEAAAAQPQSFNFETPLLRDGFVTLPTPDQPMWMVVRYQVVNPGAWLLHCHIQIHLSGGMAVAMLDGVDDFPIVPEEYR